MFKRRKKDKFVDPEGPCLLTKKDNDAMLARCIIRKASEVPPIIWNDESIPEARVRDKLGHDHAWEVIESSFNPAEKTMSVTHKVGVSDIETKVFSYEDICKKYGWKSFEVSENLQTIYPKW